MSIDAFRNVVDSPIAPSELCFSITPSDGADLTHVTKALYVGTGGNVTLLSLTGTADVTFANVASGTILDVRARAVRATGTTASDIVGLA